MSGTIKNHRPFLKWAGNKYRIIERIRRHLPPGKRLIEPFAGSAAVFLNTDFQRYLVADSNADLIDLYVMLKKNGDQFIDQARRLFGSRYNNPETYYRRREEFNSCRDTERKAALFVYLNRHGYNGLCRYSAKGNFNVPFGRYKLPYFPEKEMLFFHHKARHASFKHRDFEQIFKSAKQGDVIYCDPPYVPLSESANFTSYSAGGFDLERQQQLADIAHKTAQRGIPVLISNHRTGFTERAYQHASQREFFQVKRFISCNGNRRHHAGEVLALFS
jgi:DNA adenine methylase